MSASSSRDTLGVSPLAPGRRQLGSMRSTRRVAIHVFLLTSGLHPRVWDTSQHHFYRKLHRQLAADGFRAGRSLVLVPLTYGGLPLIWGRIRGTVRRLSWQACRLSLAGLPLIRLATSGPSSASLPAILEAILGLCASILGFEFALEQGGSRINSLFLLKFNRSLNEKWFGCRPRLF